MTPTSCANYDTATSEGHPLKVCGGCKNVGYCDKACQKAGWKTHKSLCNYIRETKKHIDEATLKDIKDSITAAEESLLPGGHLQFGYPIMIPNDSSYAIPMSPTQEMPRGFHKIIQFPPEWVASISHLSAEEQEETKKGLANQVIQMEKAREAHMTPERREAERLQALEIGRVQKRFLDKMAAKDAAKDAKKK
jgi:hypothetical protein